MSKGGNTGTSVATTTNEPWKELSPYLLGYLNNTADWFYGPNNWARSTQTPQGIYDTNATVNNGIPSYGEVAGSGQPGVGGQVGTTTSTGTTGGLVNTANNNYNMNTVEGQQQYQNNLNQKVVTGQPVYQPNFAPRFGGGTGTSNTDPSVNPGGNQPTSDNPYGGQTTSGQVGSNLPNWMQQPMVASLDPYLQTAYSRTLQRANSGSPVMNAAQQQAYNSLSGAYLNPASNPAWQTGVNDIADQFNNKLMPGIASQFSLAGRTGSGAQQDAVRGAATGAMNSINSLWGNLYNQERQNQLAYGQMAPGYAAQDYNDLQAMAGVGQSMMDYNQQLINAPLNRLQQFGALFAPGSGYGVQTSSTPMYRNPYAGALGGAAAGAGIGNMVGGPMGAGIGAGAGLLLGGY